MRNTIEKAAAILALVVGVSVGGAFADSTTQPDLQTQVNELRAEVAQLKAERPTPATQPSPEAMTAAIQNVIADTDAHSKLFDSAADFSSGWSNNRFVIQSADGNYVIRPWIHIQIRDGTAYRHDGKNGGTTDDLQNGFEIRRARLGFDGNLFTPDFTYFINWATNRQNATGTVVNSSGASIGTVTEVVGGAPIMEEAWVKYHFPDTPFYVKGGQLHDPLDHEAIIGSKYRAPEDSLTGDIFANTDTFTQGATLIFDPKESVRVEGGFTDGIRAANTNFEDYPNNGVVYDFGAAARVEWKAMGVWHDYDQLTALNDSKDLLVFGLGGDNSQGGDSNSLSVTPDVQYGSTSGLFFYGSYFARYTTHNRGIPSGSTASTSIGTPGTPNQDTYEYSGLAQAAYLIGGKFEPYVRYEYLHLAGTPAGSQNFIHEISAGANYYFYGHNAMLTGQAMFLPDGIPINDDTDDVLISNNHTELVFIMQFQLLLYAAQSPSILFCTPESALLWLLTRRCVSSTWGGGG